MNNNEIDGSFDYMKKENANILQKYCKRKK